MTKAQLPTDAFQVRMARAGLKLSVRELAEAAKVSPNTITRLESGQPCNASTLEALKRALQDRGAVFRDDGSVLIAAGIRDASE